MFFHHLKEMDPEQQRCCKIAVGSTVAAVLATRFVMKIYRSHKAQALIREKQEETRKEKVALRRRLQSLGTPMSNMDRITGMSFGELQEQLKAGSLKPEDLLQAYQAKSLIVDDRVNCISEVVREADANSLTPEQLKGPLSGIPVSVKDMMNLTGYDSTWGLVRRIHLPSKEDCVLNKVLKSQGAIIFAMTNMAQLGFAIDSANYIFGETVNPYSTKHTAGGSSGGEGAMVGGGGSPLGFGTDLGGSIRIPSSYCGLAGLKPTVGRISMAGVEFPFEGVGAVAWTVGPMARDVNTVVTAMRALLCEEMFRLDSTVPPMPFKEEVYQSKKPLRIGYYETFRFTTEAVPAMRRGVLRAKAALEAMGHTLVPFTPPDEDMAGWGLAMRSIFDDNGRSMVRALKNERIHPNFRLTYGSFALPRWTKKVLRVLLWPFGNSMSFIINTLAGSANIDETWDQIRALEIYRLRFVEAWDAAQLDGLLGPVTPYPAPALGMTKYVFGSVGYTMMYNTINVPAGTVNVGKVTRDDIQAMRQAADKGDYPNDYVHRQIVKMQEDSEGLPVGVQCIAKRWQDEVVMRMMRDVEEGLPKVQ